MTTPAQTSSTVPGVICTQIRSASGLISAPAEWRLLFVCILRDAPIPPSWQQLNWHCALLPNVYTNALALGMFPQACCVGPSVALLLLLALLLVTWGLSQSLHNHCPHAPSHCVTHEWASHVPNTSHTVDGHPVHNRRTRQKKPAYHKQWRIIHSNVCLRRSKAHMPCRSVHMGAHIRCPPALPNSVGLSHGSLMGMHNRMNGCQSCC